MNIYVILILVFILLTFVLALYVFVKQSFSRGLTDEDLVYIKAHWEDVNNIVDENPIKAILDADKILDYALSRCGFEGSLGEKLKMAAPRFYDVNEVWAAHKLRNTVAHELTEELEERDVKVALKRFKRALKDLGARL
ncbi:MAG: hypothetical protein WCX95_03565 [Candidatus Gracilibacteria bacterium]